LSGLLRLLTRLLLAAALLAALATLTALTAALALLSTECERGWHDRLEGGPLSDLQSRGGGNRPRPEYNG
jgi:hypothetical protein